MLLKQKTQLKKLLYQHLSELLVYCRHGIPGWLLQGIASYPGRRQWEACPERVSVIKGISKAKAKNLLAKLEAGQANPLVTVEHTIAATARQILHLQTLIDAEQEFLIGQYGDHPDVMLLCSIKGVGLASAVRLVIETEDITRFDTKKQLCAYFGCTLCGNKAGMDIGKKG